MIGIIVTGHGQFAGGLVSALKLLTGEPEALLAVDFEEGDDIGRLEEKLKAAVESLRSGCGSDSDGRDGCDSCDGILVMTDLRGGSPFNVSARLAVSQADLEVLTGTNLGMLVEAYMSRQMAAGVTELARTTASSGKDQVGYFEKVLSVSADDEDEIELD